MLFKTQEKTKNVVQNKLCLQLITTYNSTKFLKKKITSQIIQIDLNVIYLLQN